MYNRNKFSVPWNLIYFSRRPVENYRNNRSSNLQPQISVNAPPTNAVPVAPMSERRNLSFTELWVPDMFWKSNSDTECSSLQKQTTERSRNGSGNLVFSKPTLGGSSNDLCSNLTYPSFLSHTPAAKGVKRVPRPNTEPSARRKITRSETILNINDTRASVSDSGWAERFGSRLSSLDGCRSSSYFNINLQVGFKKSSLVLSQM